MNELTYTLRAKLKSYLIKNIITCKTAYSYSSLDDLKVSMMRVTRPDYHVTNLVFGDGISNPQIMFIGEAPGEEEDQSGLPFVGKSGRLLRNIIDYMQVSYYITNVVPYRPPHNRNPTEEEIKLWKPYLIEHINLINPQLIVLVGKIAAHTMLATDCSMLHLRSKIHTVMNKKAIVFYHPSYLIRLPSQKKQAYEDVKLVLSILNK